MGKFKQFLLLEMPVDTGPSTGTYTDVPENNEEITKEYMETQNKIGTIRIKGRELSIYYSDKYGFEYNLIDESEMTTVGEYTFVDHDDFIEELSIWQNKQYMGFFREWFKRFILPKHKWVISDEKHSKEGFNFWTKVIVELGDTIEFGVVDYKTNTFRELSSTTKMYKYWKADEGYRDFRFYIKLK